MERQTGLGRSLNEVIDSLTPAEPDAPLTRGTDLHDITPQLYRLVLEVQDLRDRVDVLETANGNGAKHAPTKPKRAKAKTSNGKRSDPERNARSGKKTKRS